MDKLERAVTFTIIMATVLSQRKCQPFRFPPEAAQEDLSEPIIKDMLSILVNGTVNALGSCTDTYNPSLVQFWLFTKTNPNKPKILTSNNQIDFRKTTKILIHGWGGNADVYYIKMIKDAYLRKRDYNIISVNFPTYAKTDYLSAYCNVPIVGKIIAKFICNLRSKISIKSLHIIGHSLGAHVAGVASNETIQKCNQTIGRITGLDPAGPLFQCSDKSVRLDGDDALTVDVIHTNQGQLGYIGKCGTIDFYPNCGYYQPKCLSITINNITKTFDVLRLPTAISTPMKCNHQMSCNFFVETIINGHGFPTVPCLFCGLPVCFPKPEIKLLRTGKIDMGEYSSPLRPEETEYVVYT